MQSFVNAYNNARPLKAIELENFFTHMKLCLLDVALEMYSHMYVIGDLPVSRLLNNPNNSCLEPNLLAQIIISLSDKSSFYLKGRDSSTFPIFFFGLSGVGKTTLIHAIAASELFYIPKFTVTRAPRTDDDPKLFEYMSVNEFEKRKDSGEFFVWMSQGGTYYGYRNENLIINDKYPLMNSSAYGIDAVSQINGLKVLVEGPHGEGLKLRGDTKVLETRKKVNQVAIEKFFGKEDFRKKMDIVFFNEFGNREISARELKKKIIKGIDHAN